MNHTPGTGAPPRPTRRRWWWVAGATVIVALAATGLWARQQASDFEALARAGKTDAAAGVKSIEGKRPDEALASFTRATEEFTRARGLLGPDWLQGVPWLGRQLAAAGDLATIGAEGAKAGAEAAQVYARAGTSGGAPLGTQLQEVRPHLDAALASLVIVADRSKTLSADGLVPQLAVAVNEAKQLLDPMELVLSRSRSLLELERYLFTTTHRFLVVSQNSAELRPTGGFMGTFGLVEIGPEGFHLTTYADVYTLPKDTLNLPLPEGGQVNYKHFYFRNTNWWMDFPTSTRVMTQFWQNLEQPRIDGIVALDIPTIRDLLAVFGPIRVPESKVPLTAENVMEQLTYVVEYDNSGGQGVEGKKNAVVSLAAELVRRVTNLRAEDMEPTLAALTKSANEKHVQVWFADPAAQTAIVDVGWSGALAPPAGTTDLLAVSNGVIKPSKANLGVTKTLDYRVALGTDGSADTTLTLGYRKSTLTVLGMGQEWLANYVRVHRTAGTTASDPDRTPAGFASLTDATGLPTFGHYFRLDRGRSTSVTLHTTVADAVQAGPAPTLPGVPSAPPATGDAWHYRLLVAKQADLVDTDATVTVTVPEGWKVAGSAAWLRVSGKTVPTSAVGGSVSLHTPLTQDVLLDLSLTRS